MKKISRQPVKITLAKVKEWTVDSDGPDEPLEFQAYNVTASLAVPNDPTIIRYDTLFREVGLKIPAMMSETIRATPN